MKIAILGGTGKIGTALAMRLDRAGHQVILGSRDKQKAIEAALALKGQIAGSSNDEAAAECDAAFIAVPYSGHAPLLESVKHRLAGKVVIDTTVPLNPANLLQVKTRSGASATEESASTLQGAFVFAAFQTISHRVLRHVDMLHDVLVAGAAERKPDVMELIRSMQLKPVDAGPMEVAGHLERVTALLLSINRANRVKESGIKITGI